MGSSLSWSCMYLICIYYTLIIINMWSLPSPCLISNVTLCSTVSSIYNKYSSQTILYYVLCSVVQWKDKSLSMCQSFILNFPSSDSPVRSPVPVSIHMDIWDIWEIFRRVLLLYSQLPALMYYQCRQTTYKNCCSTNQFQGLSSSRFVFLFVE